MTPEELAWLNAQRAELVTAYERFDAFIRALKEYENEARALAWWEFAKRYRRRRGLAYFECMKELQAQHIRLLSQCIDVWVTTQQFINSPARGPLLPKAPPSDRPVSGTAPH